MRKFWIVYANKNSGVFQHHTTYDDAMDDAKRKQEQDRGNVYYVLEAMTATKLPVPDVQMVSLREDPGAGR